MAEFVDRDELSRSLLEGLDALRAGDDDRATAELGRAVQLADASGDNETVRVLRRLVAVDDAVTGVVHMRRDVSPEAESEVEARSTMIIRKRGPER